MANLPSAYVPASLLLTFPSPLGALLALLKLTPFQFVAPTALTLSSFCLEFLLSPCQADSYHPGLSPDLPLQRSLLWLPRLCQVSVCAPIAFCVLAPASLFSLPVNFSGSPLVSKLFSWVDDHVCSLTVESGCLSQSPAQGFSVNIWWAVEIKHHMLFVWSEYMCGKSYSTANLGACLICGYKQYIVFLPLFIVFVIMVETVLCFFD